MSQSPRPPVLSRTRRSPSGAARATLVPLAALVVLFAVLAACSSGAGANDDAVPGSPGATGSGTSGAAKPNIVLIMTDDMTASELSYMPRVKKLLIDRGVTFSDFTAPQPLCCPARAQMLTGQYAQNNGVKTNAGPEGGYAQFHPDTAMPVWLHNAGYQTAMVGKYLNGYPQDHPSEVGWDHWDPTIRRIYEYFGYTQYADGAYTRPPEYHTNYVADQSVKLISQMSAEKRPFFLWSSFIAPHGVCKVKDEIGNCAHPPRPDPRDLGKDDGKPVPVLKLPSYNEKDMSDKPPFLRDNGPRKLGNIVATSHRRAEALIDVVRSVEKIVTALRRAGTLNNTLILFTSDNGYLLGQHRYVGKVLGYEESVRVPLIMRGLGLPRGITDPRTYAMIDLAPTFAALAGATPLLDVDGAPIVVRNGLGKTPPDRTLLIQAGVTNVRKYPDGWWFRGVRTRRYTYVAWADGFRELYDRRRDPYELNSVAGFRAYARIQRILAHRLDVLGPCAGATCRTPFANLPEPRRDLTGPAAGASGSAGSDASGGSTAGAGAA